MEALFAAEILAADRDFLAWFDLRRRDRRDRRVGSIIASQSGDVLAARRLGRFCMRRWQREQHHRQSQSRSEKHCRMLLLYRMCHVRSPFYLLIEAAFLVLGLSQYKEV